MFYISWWFCLSGFILLSLLFIILKVIDCILFHIIHNLNIWEKFDNICFIVFKWYEKYSIPIIFVPIILICINNITILVKENIKQTNIRIESNKKYLTNCGIKYHFYKIKSVNPTTYSNNIENQYVYTEKDINTLLKEPYIKLNNGGYVKLQSIIEISLNEFIQKYDKLIEKE